MRLLAHVLRRRGGRVHSPRESEGVLKQKGQARDPPDDIRICVRLRARETEGWPSG